MDNKVQVITRVRPLLENEHRGLYRGEPLTSESTLVQDDIHVTNVPGMIQFTFEGEDSIELAGKKFKFNKVYPPWASQEEVYNGSIQNIVKSCFEGYNATIFAYGQTGSGKTYSMTGSSQPNRQDEYICEDEGVIPRALHQIFSTIKAASLSASSLTTYNVRVSMIEIYNEECRDLLATCPGGEISHDSPATATAGNKEASGNANNVLVREDKNGKVYLVGSKEISVGSLSHSLALLQHGNNFRSVGGTLMNTSSSRSHAIFTVYLDIIENPSDFSKNKRAKIISSKLHLVDLAGSERANKTGAQGQRFKESIGINQGLFALGKVIRALTKQNESGSSSANSVHIPYRDSKLTRLLQDSLGGNCLSLLLACLSPSLSSMGESLHTLTYATHARAIHNQAVANVRSVISRNNDLMKNFEGNGMNLNQFNVISKSLSKAQEELNEWKEKTHKLYEYIDKCFNGFNEISDSLIHGNIEEGLNYSTKYKLFLEQVVEKKNFIFKNDDQHEKISNINNVENLNINESNQEDILESSLLDASIVLKELQDDLISPHRPIINDQDQLLSEIESLREALENAQEDLLRDEEIFAEKSKELREVKKRNRELISECERYEREKENLKNKFWKLLDKSDNNSHTNNNQIKNLSEDEIDQDFEFFFGELDALLLNSKENNFSMKKQPLDSDEIIKEYKQKIQDLEKQLTLTKEENSRLATKNTSIMTSVQTDMKKLQQHIQTKDKKIQSLEQLIEEYNKEKGSLILNNNEKNKKNSDEKDENLILSDDEINQINHYLNEKVLILTSLFTSQVEYNRLIKAKTILKKENEDTKYKLKVLKNNYLKKNNIKNEEIKENFNNEEEEELLRKLNKIELTLLKLKKTLKNMKKNIEDNEEKDDIIREIQLQNDLKNKYLNELQRLRENKFDQNDLKNEVSSKEIDEIQTDLEVINEEILKNEDLLNQNLKKIEENIKNLSFLKLDKRKNENNEYELYLISSSSSPSPSSSIDDSLEYILNEILTFYTSKIIRINKKEKSSLPSSQLLPLYHTLSSYLLRQSLIHSVSQHQHIVHEEHQHNQLIQQQEHYQANLTKLKKENDQKIFHLKRECEDKITFLLQKLRDLEQSNHDHYLRNQEVIDSSDFPPPPPI